MPSEHRLHPLSIAFSLGGQIRRAILPLIFGAASASFVGGLGVRTIIVGTLILLAVNSVIRFLTFRYRYEAGELVIRTGLVFRRERHVPYARIQNLDAVQGVFHRVLGVVEVKVQTGGGAEPEATMTVLPLEAFDALRNKVFEGRGEPTADEAPGVGVVAPASDSPTELRTPDLASTSASGHELLHLSVRELLLYGVIANRGMIVIAAGFGVLWETGIVDRMSGWAVGEGAWAEGLIRGLVTDISTGGGVAAGGVAAAVGLFVAVLVFARLLSMAWALVRLHDYRVVRDGEDLRTTFGLLTQVAATIPLRRIQTVTIHESPLHRWTHRVAVGVQTAGGQRGQQNDPHRQWLAPILRRDRLEAFLAAIVPELDLSSVTWGPVASGAFRRFVKRTAIPASALSIPFYVLWGFWGAAVHLVLVGWATFYANRYVARLGWVADDDTVLFRSGWLWRRTSIARFAKIQVVSVTQTPFDRLREMATVHVDTAGAGAASHKVEIPFLPLATARGLGERLAAAAAQTAFRW